MSELERRLDVLAGEDEWARHREIEAMGAVRVSQRDLETLVSALDHDDATRRTAARTALVALGAPDSPSRAEAQAALRAALRSDRSNVRVLAAAALGDAGDPTAGDALIAALADPATNVRVAAADALGELRHGPALEALSDLSRSDELWVRAAAIVGLGRLGDERAIPRLAALAEEPGLEKPIIEALGRINHPAALEPLRRAAGAVPDQALRTAGAILSAHPDIDPPDWVRSAARREEEALRHELVEEDTPALARLLGLSGSGDALDCLIDLVGPPRRSEAALAGLMAAPPELRADAILERLPGSDERETETLLAVLPALADPERIRALVPFLDHDAAAVRSAAAEALARCPPTEALPLLEAEIERGGAAPEVIRAVGGLGEAACTSLVPLLEDPSPAVRAAAANALSRCAEHGTEADLRAALAREDDPAAREALVRALARAAGRGAMDVLVEGLASERLDMRLAAIQALGTVGDEAAVAELERALDGEPAERLAALQALGSLGQAAAAPLVARYVGAADLDLRRAAARAAVRVGAAMPPDSVRTMAADEDPWIRTCAARILARQAPPGRDRLEVMAAEDPDAEVRSVARLALDDVG